MARRVAVPGRFLWSRVFARSLRAPLRVLLRQRSVREGALRRARNLVSRNPYLPRLSRLLKLRALRPLRLVKLLRVRLPRRFLLHQFLLPARRLACPPRLT